MSAWIGVRVAVWGAARSGVAAANLLADLGAEVVLSDSRALDALDLEGLDARVTVRGGGNVLDGATVLVPSPGIPPHAPALAAARSQGVLLVSEVELAASVSRAPVVCITGTDGKSTTTEMIGAVVRAAGRPAEVAGNIGTPLSERARALGADGVLVAEVSEFQLWSCGHFKPRVVVVTNVAEDHTDYFGGDMGAVADSMARALRDLGPGDTAVLRADDPIVWGFPVPEGVVRVPFGPHPRAEGWGLSEGWLTQDGVPVMAATDLSLPGPHNVANAQAALAAGVALGLPRAPMCQALRTFKGLPHRLERVRERNGVLWLDDSKATNPHAAAVGLRAQSRPLVIITGGYDKGLDLRPFCDAAAERAHAVVAVGPTAARTATTLAGRVPVEVVPDLATAVARAELLSRSGDTVVLSPAASSFDAWRSYAHRGDAFQALVLALPEV